MPVDRVNGIWDYQRCYLLPDRVVTNIPRHRMLGSLGAHEAARGLLVEICRYTGARPGGLVYSEHDVRVPDRPGTTTVVTVVALARLPDGSPLSVVTRHHQHPRIDRDDDWSIQLDATVLHAETRRYPPSPVYQGLLVAWHLHRRRDPLSAGE